MKIQPKHLVAGLAVLTSQLEGLSEDILRVGRLFAALLLLFSLLKVAAELLQILQDAEPLSLWHGAFLELAVAAALADVQLDLRFGLAQAVRLHR